MLKGLAICDLQPDGYRGVCRSNQLADYMTDAKIGGRVTDFLENFVDDESQEIRCTVAAACAARQRVDLLRSRGADCELITFNDEHESAGLLGGALLGYDVCAQDLSVSPLADGLIRVGVTEYEEALFPEFFEELNGQVLREYAEDLNDNFLFATEKTAQEVCAFMNYLSATYDNEFYCMSDYAVFAVFDGKDPA